MQNNHIVDIKDLQKAVQQVKKQKKKIKVEVEVKNLKEVRLALDSRADIIMLDNMNMQMIKKSIRLIKFYKQYRPEIEVSGNVNLANIRRYANLGADRISVGALTHSVKALDLSIELQGHVPNSGTRT